MPPKKSKKGKAPAKPTVTEPVHDDANRVTKRGRKPTKVDPSALRSTLNRYYERYGSLSPTPSPSPPRSRIITRSLTAALHEIRRGPDTKQIFVKTVTGRTLTLGMSRSGTIAQLHRLIEFRGGITKGQQRMIFAGRQLGGCVEDEDDELEQRTLASYGIQGEPILSLVLRLAGS